MIDIDSAAMSRKVSLHNMTINYMQSISLTGEFWREIVAVTLVLGNYIKRSKFGLTSSGGVVFFDVRSILNVGKSLFAKSKIM